MPFFMTTTHSPKRTSPDTRRPETAAQAACSPPSAQEESAFTARPQSSSSSSSRGVITVTPIPPANIIAVIDLSSCESESDDEEIPKSFILYCKEKWAKEKALQEAQELKDQLTCKLCYESEVKITFVPCGHLSACAACAATLRTCPFCRKYIRKKVTTFM